jgi:FAD:protein FMN transferase
MASPCEVLVEGAGERKTRELAGIAAAEVWRIETKFSRYRDDSVLAEITKAAGARHAVDAETADLLDFAATCHAVSEGAFDITSGVLRRAWKFDGSDRLPTPAQVRDLLVLVGWHKVTWQRPTLTLPLGMELDFGGFGKEYAADRAAGLLREADPECACLVNLGGDLVLSRPRRDGTAWAVGIESPTAGGAERALDLRSGAICTSGDARRFLRKDGIRYSHILDPRTGWPVAGAPRAVTVAASNCTEAGLLCTLGMLAGAHAAAFLSAQGLPHWIAHG